jgi:multidrug efflux system membrane fusion protein
MNGLNRMLRAASVLTLASVTGACSGGGAPPEFPPTPVDVAAVVQQDVTETREFSGRLTAVTEVEIRPRVGGYLTEVHFGEGKMVEQGELLFSIDEREYQAALAAAKADLARAESRLDVATIEFGRNERLIKSNAISQGILDAARGEKQQATADLALARARVREAELDMEFTRIRAPFRGRIGEARIKPGNLVTPDQTLLTTLVSVDPVHVRFEPDEDTYLMLQQTSQNDAAGTPAPLDLEVAVGGTADFLHRARLAFINNVIDTSTGTITAWAVLDNPDGRFTPGLFARVRVPVRTIANALLIRERAILTDQDRKYVYVVGDGDVAERRNITLGAQVDDLRVIRDGLAPGDRVVVSGSKKIFFPGAPIAPTDQAMVAEDDARVAVK